MAGEHPASARSRYGRIAQALHWATAILVLIAFTFGPGGSELRVYSAARDFDRQLHETLGLCVFILVTLRVLWRAIDETPRTPPAPRWMELAAKAVHVALYALLFALPLTAIAGAWLEGHPLTLLGGIEIPALVAKSHDLGAGIANLHTWLGDTIMWLAGLHALAAIYHQFVLDDGLLASMLPRSLAERLPAARRP
jgi:cytochrome b561